MRDLYREYSLTTGAAAEQLGVSRDTVSRRALAGDIPFWRAPGGFKRFRQADIDAYILEHSPKAS